jgi:serine phosphatase RsbU (regulator of sigma subunit)
LLYTDGLTEAKNRDGREFGEARLVDFIRTHEELSAEVFAERLLHEVLAWPGNGNSHPQSDDITIVAIDIGRSQ